ncbi:alpha/beta hydrolase [Salinisphaera aquimarina]|uniref:Alpha/beta hydrolase n=1 Tax=Salinisphaera aquimarina TaxID=2094031 RepID=A0ABV7EMK4_9GAMM
MILATTRCEDLRIHSTETPGEHIHLRKKYAGETPASPGKAILFVHGATYPGAMFDVAGSSWLDHAVADGYAAYALDVRGYGASTRPAALDAPPRDNKPFARAESAVADITDCVATIRERTGVETIDIVGWSWGTMTSGMYAASQPGSINRLVLFAPVYCCHRADRIAGLADRDDPSQLRMLGAYRTENIDDASTRWNSEITAADPDDWRDPAILEAWFTAMLKNEPGDAVRAPNGVLVDLWEAFNERPRYDAGAIKVPTLVIRGSADATAIRADGLTLFDALGSEHKQYVEIAHTTHFALLERRAPQLFESVSRFLSGSQK